VRNNKLLKYSKLDMNSNKTVEEHAELQRINEIHSELATALSEYDGVKRAKLTPLTQSFLVN
jgi:hypothetical protein